MKGRIFSINQSQAKGVPKLPVNEGYLKEGWGLLGDAHSGNDTENSISGTSGRQINT